MSQELIREVHKTGLKTVPEIRAGYTVRVHQKIKEGGKERIQIFEGLVIKVGSGEGLDKSFTVRKVASGVGVEKVFPIYSSNIAQIEVIKKAKVRKAKLYYMRERTGKAARLKETRLKAEDVKMIEVKEEVVEEAPEAPATERAEVKPEETKDEPKEEPTETPATEQIEEKTEEAKAEAEAPDEKETKDEA